MYPLRSFLWHNLRHCPSLVWTSFHNTLLDFISTADPFELVSPCYALWKPALVIVRKQLSISSQRTNSWGSLCIKISNDFNQVLNFHNLTIIWHFFGHLCNVPLWYYWSISFFDVSFKRFSSPISQWPYITLEDYIPSLGLFRYLRVFLTVFQCPFCFLDSKWQLFQLQISANLSANLLRLALIVNGDRKVLKHCGIPCSYTYNCPSSFCIISYDGVCTPFTFFQYITLFSAVQCWISIIYKVGVNSEWLMVISQASSIFLNLN